jgi:hypothetical protein
MSNDLCMLIRSLDSQTFPVAVLVVTIGFDHKRSFNCRQLALLTSFLMGCDGKVANMLSEQMWSEE